MLLRMFPSFSALRHYSKSSRQCRNSLVVFFCSVDNTFMFFFFSVVPIFLPFFRDVRVLDNPGL